MIQIIVYRGSSNGNRDNKEEGCGGVAKKETF